MLPQVAGPRNVIPWPCILARSDFAQGNARTEGRVRSPTRLVARVGHIVRGIETHIRKAGACSSSGPRHRQRASAAWISGTNHFTPTLASSATEADGRRRSPRPSGPIPPSLTPFAVREHNNLFYPLDIPDPSRDSRRLPVLRPRIGGQTTGPRRPWRRWVANCTKPRCYR
jgi:hypothetical protein